LGRGKGYDGKARARKAELSSASWDRDLVRQPKATTPIRTVSIAGMQQTASRRVLPQAISSVADLSLLLWLLSRLLFDFSQLRAARSMHAIHPIGSARADQSATGW
jgi:hypothetical protein